ncbi:MAG: hypothetical protein ACQESZ_10115 [Bacteroidota bacterium]
MKWLPLFVVFFFCSETSSSQDTIFVTLNRKNCLPCYGSIYSFVKGNDIKSVIAGLALADTNRSEYYKDKMIANQMLSFCDTIILIKSVRENNFLNPISDYSSQLYYPYLTRPSPMLIIKRQKSIAVFPASQISVNNKLNKTIRDMIVP